MFVSLLMKTLHIESYLINVLIGVFVVLVQIKGILEKELDDFQ